MKKSDYIQVIKKYKREILQCSALAVTVVCACAMSYIDVYKRQIRKTGALPSE